MKKEIEYTNYLTDVKLDFLIPYDEELEYDELDDIQNKLMKVENVYKTDCGHGCKCQFLVVYNFKSNEIKTIKQIQNELVKIINNKNFKQSKPDCPDCGSVNNISRVNDCGYEFLCKTCNHCYNFIFQQKK